MVEGEKERERETERETDRVYGVINYQILRYQYCSNLSHYYDSESTIDDLFLFMSFVYRKIIVSYAQIPFTLLRQTLVCFSHIYIKARPCPLKHVKYVFILLILINTTCIFRFLWGREEDSLSYLCPAVSMLSCDNIINFIFKLRNKSIYLSKYALINKYVYMYARK